MNLMLLMKFCILVLFVFFNECSGDAQRRLMQRENDSDIVRLNQENQNDFARLLSSASKGSTIVISAGTIVELDSLTELAVNKVTILGEGNDRQKPTINCSSKDAKIKIKGNKIKLQNLTIQNCTAPAVEVESPARSNRINAKLSQVDFKDNRGVGSTSSQLGIGSLLIRKNTKAKITDCHFKRNVAESGAGVHIEQPSDVRISGCMFIKNEGAGIWSEREAYYDEEHQPASRLIVERSEFVKNKPQPDVIARLRDELLSPNGSPVEASIFINFVAPNSAAGALFASSVEQLEIRNCVFRENGATHVGAVMLEDINNVTVDGCVFKENAPTNMNNEDASYGGAIYYQQTEIRPSQISISSSEFVNNSAGSGGAIHAVGTANTEMTLDQSRFIENNANRYGGATLVRNFKVTLLATILSKNEAHSGGAIALLNGGSLTTEPGQIVDHTSLEDRLTSFLNNKATDGGALFISGTSVVRVIETRFSKNIASRDGGAVCVVHTLSGSSTKFESSFFRENRAARGGALFSTSASDIIFRGGFSDIRRDPRTVRYLAENPEELTEGFFRNKALAGGAIYIRASNPFENKLTIASLQFADNQAVSSADNFPMDANLGSSSLQQFTSDNVDVLADDPCYPGGGGAACIVLHDVSPRAYAKYELSKLDFTSNSAVIGGALLISTAGTWNTSSKASCSNNGDRCFRVVNSTFDSNRAVGAGGAIFSTYPNTILFAEDQTMSSATTLNELEFPHTSFINNRVKRRGYGPNTASLGRTLQMMTPEEKLQDLESGGDPYRLTVRLADAFNQTVTGNIMDASMPLRLYSEKGIASGSLHSTISRGYANFRVVITASPGNYTLEIRGERPTINLSANVSTRGCFIGEYNVRNILCNVCSRGSYGLDINVPCQTCSSHATCSGGAVIVPNEGYWHSTPFSPVIHDCLEPEACKYHERKEILERFFSEQQTKGNLTLAAKPFEKEYPQCHEGYQGILCGSCSPDYGRIANGKCKSCKNESRTRFLVIFSGIWMLILMAFTIRSALISIRDFITVKTHVQSRATHAQNISTPMSPNIGAATSVNGQVIHLSGHRTTHSSDSDAITPSPTFRGPGGLPNIPQIGPASILNSPPPQVGHIQPTPPIDHILAAEKISETIKIFTNFLQITSVGILINVEWTEALKQVLTLQDGIAGFSNGSSIAPMECIVGGSSEERSIRHAILRIFMPVILMVITIFFFALHWLRLKAKQNKPFSYLRSRIVICALVASFFSYHKITEHLMRILNCTHLDYGKELSLEKCPACQFYKYYAIAREYYWAENTSLMYALSFVIPLLKLDHALRCFEGNHANLAYFLGFPGLFFFTLGVPMTILGTLLYFKAHGRLNDNEVLNSFGFVYQNYKDYFMFWEVCIMCRKAVVGAIVVFAYSLGGNLQSVMILGTLLIALLSQIAAFPFNDYALNCLETSSLLVSILTFYFAIVFNDPNTSGHAKNAFSVVLFILTLALVIAFFAVLVYNMEAFVEAKLKQMGHSVPHGRIQRPFKLLKVMAGNIFVSAQDQLLSKIKTMQSNRARRRDARKQKRVDKQAASLHATNSAAASNSGNQSAMSSPGTASLQVQSVGTSITINPSN